MSTLKQVIQIGIPVAIIGGGFLLGSWILNNPPQPRRRSKPAPPVSVDVRELHPTRHQVVLHSQGTVQASMESSLAAEVQGRVVSVSPAFRNGARVEKGAVLVRISPEEYDLAVKELEQQLEAAGAALEELNVQVRNAEAQLELVREKLELQQRQLARVQGLRKRGVASEEALLEALTKELAVREAMSTQENQRRSLLARRTTLQRGRSVAAQRLARARLDLDRTVVRSPFNARVVERRVGEGQYVTRGAVLGRVHALDRAEVRLPLSGHQLAHLDLPTRADAPGVPVTLSAKVGPDRFTWKGIIRRAEGQVDPASRQLSVIAEVEHPEDREGGRPALRPGTFVSARIQGRTLEGVFELPRTLVTAENVVLVADPEEGLLRRRSVEVVWRTADLLVVRKGLRAGELLCVTPLLFGGDELKVELKRVEPKAAK